MLPDGSPARRMSGSLVALIAFGVALLSLVLLLACCVRTNP